MLCKAGGEEFDKEATPYVAPLRLEAGSSTEVSYEHIHLKSIDLQYLKRIKGNY